MSASITVDNVNKGQTPKEGEALIQGSFNSRDVTPISFNKELKCVKKTCLISLPILGVSIVFLAVGAKTDQKSLEIVGSVLLGLSVCSIAFSILGAICIIKNINFR